MYEFIFLSALDAGNDALIDGCIGPLMQKFPKGNRIRVLIGQWNEYRGILKWNFVWVTAE